MPFTFYICFFRFWIFNKNVFTCNLYDFVNVKGVWGGWIKISVLNNNQRSFDELTWQMHKKKKITKVGKSISTYLELSRQKRTERKRNAITNDWLDRNKWNKKQLGFLYNYFKRKKKKNNSGFPVWETKRMRNLG